MRTLRSSLALGSALLMLLAAGCGLAPTTRSHAPTRFTAQDAATDALVAKVRAAWDGLKTTQGVVSFWEQKGTAVSASKAEFYWSRPEQLRANIKEADSATKRGAKLVYLGDGKITVKVAFIKKTLPYDDPQVLSLRGYRIDQTSLTALVQGVLDPQATLKLLGSATVSGRTATLVELSGTHTLLADLPRVVIAIDDQNGLPLQVEGFEATGPAFRATVTGLVVNPTLPGDIFQL